ncbi:uncharacterized protein METZ01_LOCUS198719, partial [marine metagenome]
MVGVDTLKKTFFLILFIFNFVPLVLAGDQQLVITTNTLVTEEGKVRIHLILKNNGQRIVYDVQPMIHFHHTMA